MNVHLTPSNKLGLSIIKDNFNISMSDQDLSDINYTDSRSFIFRKTIVYTAVQRICQFNINRD